MKKAVKKYLRIYLTELQEAINYRTELFLWSIIGVMPLLGMLTIWLNVFQTTTVIGGYNLNAVIGYYLIGYMFSEVTGSHFEQGMIEQIKNGSIVRWLIKPISLKRFLYVHEISWRTMTFLTVVLPLLFITLVFVPNVLPAFNLTTTILFPFIVMIAFSIEVMLSAIVLSFGFVFEEARSLEHLKWMLQWLFSGAMVPFSFMPNWLVKIANFLPFKFRYFFPTSFLFGNLSVKEIIINLAHGLIWLMILFIILKFLWNENLKRFTAVGN